jgi:small subunit ribosomal protein S5
MSREETAYIEKLVAINRVAKVVKGGKRFSFSALVIVGDGKGKAGYAIGKAREVADAVKKATERAKKSLVRIPMREGRTLHHDVAGRFGAGKVILRSAVAGTGIIAGGAMRFIFEALGMQDIVSKSLGSANPGNMVRATFDALMSTVSPKYIASKRGKKVGEIASRRAMVK